MHKAAFTMTPIPIQPPAEPSVPADLLQQFELWARTEQGLQDSMLRKHPLADTAIYLDRIVDALWRGFNGYHELVLRGDA
jgi:hypothetical protein